MKKIYLAVMFASLVATGSVEAQRRSGPPPDQCTAEYGENWRWDEATQSCYEMGQAQPREDVPPPWAPPIDGADICVDPFTNIEYSC